MKLQPSCKDPNILEMPVPWDNHQGQQQPWCGAGLSSGDKLCDKPFGAQKIVSTMSLDITPSTVDLSVTAPSFFLSGSENV